MYSRSPLWKRDSEHEHGRNALSIGRTFTRGDSRVTTGVLASIDPSVLAEGVNLMWVAMVCFLIFFMHAGFAMLEAGQVRAKNVANQLTKNLLTWGVGVLVYFLIASGSKAWRAAAGSLRRRLSATAIGSTAGCSVPSSR